MNLHEGDIASVVDPDGTETEGLVVFDDCETEVLEADDGDDPEENFAIPTDEGRRIRKRIKALVGKVNDSYWELSELVAKVHTEKLYRQWGFKKFPDWAKDEFNLGRRKAYNFAEIQNYFNGKIKKELPEASYNEVVDTVKTIGWSKALVLAQSNVINQGNYGDVIEAAKELSYDDLKKEVVRRFKDLTDEEKENSVETNNMKTVRKSYVFTAQQEVEVTRAVTKAKSQMREGAKDSAAIALICAEYDANNSESTLAEKLSMFERLLGIQLVAIDEQGETVLYGDEVLQNMAGDDQ